MKKEKAKLPLSKIIEINQWCASVLRLATLKGELSMAIATLAYDSEAIVQPFAMHQQSTATRLQKEKNIEGEALAIAVDKETSEQQKAIKELSMPKMKLSELIADRDWPNANIVKGDILVPIGFLKCLKEWIEEEK